jgi:hypothetical protein
VKRNSASTFIENGGHVEILIKFLALEFIWQDGKGKEGAKKCEKSFCFISNILIFVSYVYVLVCLCV